MAEIKPTADRPSFQPCLGNDGVAARYLLWRIAGKVVVAESGCWEWTGARTSKGYPTACLRNPDWPESTVALHRVVYAVCVGPLAEGAGVFHHCDNPCCVRPDHLFTGSNADNVADKVEKGRQARGTAVRKNHDHLKGERVKTARLTAEQVLAIREADAAGDSPAAIADRHGISDTQVRAIVDGKSWAHLPFVRRDNRFERDCPKCGAVFSTRQGAFYRHVAACGSAAT